MATNIATVSPFTVDNGYTRAMAQGHHTRHGHHLTGYYVPTGDGLAKLVRTCCGESK